MRRSRSRASAAASSAGVSYFEKSCLEATSVISSRVRWDRIVEIRTLNGSSVSATIFARAVSPVCRSPAGRYRREKSRTMKANRSRAGGEMGKGLPPGGDLGGGRVIEKKKNQLQTTHRHVTARGGVNLIRIM